MLTTLSLALLLAAPEARADDHDRPYTWRPAKTAARRAECEAEADQRAEYAMYYELQKREEEVTAKWRAEWAEIVDRLTACVAQDEAARLSCGAEADAFAARIAKVEVSVPPAEVVVHTDCGRKKRATPGATWVIRTRDTYHAAVALAVRLREATPPPDGTWEGPRSGIRMAWLPAGSFQMSARPPSDGEGSRWYVKPHTVTFSQGYFIGVAEVTQAQWYAVTGEVPSTRQYDPSRSSAWPVETISWHDAIAFANAASEKDGLTPAYDLGHGRPTLIAGANGYRLPTQAEWERAAQGRGEATLYAGSGAVDAVSWWRGNADGQIHPACSRAPNALGLCDMSGNVREWVWDRANLWDGRAATDPIGDTGGSNAVVCGGSWLDEAEAQEITRCGEANKSYARGFIGVRLVRSGP